MIGFAVYQSSLGLIRMDYEGEILVGLKKVDGGQDCGVPTALTDEVLRQLEEYLDGIRRKFEFPYELRGTPFQKQVWHALENIPYGQTRSYLDIARAIGSPKAVRAVGAANGKNPIWIVVPCHRVIGANGSLTGYAGGMELKKQLLELESRKGEEMRELLKNG